MSIDLKSVKTPFFMLLFLLLPWSGASSQGQDADTNVVITASATRDTLAPGARAEVVLMFRPKKGYHVNAVPPVAVAFDTAGPAHDGGPAIIPADTATGYLKTALPVRQPFTLSRTASGGRADLRGKVTYYYCSETEGWCRKETSGFTVPVTVK